LPVIYITFSAMVVKFPRRIMLVSSRLVACACAIGSPFSRDGTTVQDLSGTFELLPVVRLR
jgi:hypothetical protein